MNVPAKHSPPPWRFCIDGEMDDDCNIPKVDAPLSFRARGYGNNPSIIDANGGTVVGCLEYNIFDSPNQPSNVALMLSAPELLAALRKAETWVATFSDQVGNPTGPLANDLAEIRAAIAKATGGAA